MQTTGPASPEQPPAVDPAEVEVKVGVGPRAKEEAVVKADVEDEEGEQEEEKGGRGARRQRRRRGGGAGDGGAVVMVKRELLARCMTCPLCRRLLRDATTISECLHTCESFLLSLACSAAPADPGGLERSVPRVLWELPATEIRFGSLLVLGAAPDLVARGPGTWVGAVGVDSFPAIRKRCAAFWAFMRDCDSRRAADHNIQDVRSKVFPFKRKKINAEEAGSPVTLPIKRKERSISSLVVNTPRITPAGSTGRRTRAVTRKAAALRGLGPIIADPLKKDNDNSNKQSDNSSLLGSLSKVPQTRRQVLSNGDTSNHPSGKDKAGDNKDLDKAELWKPLNCLVEAASKTKPRTSAQSPALKGDKPSGSPSSEHYSRTKAREPLQKTKAEDDKDDPEPIVLLRKRGPGRKRKHPLPLPNAASSAAAIQNAKKFIPIWFSLIASFDQKGEPPLPQIPAHYLRIK
ncbi:hypothetical protein HU200_039810 [Digitaria exilis]|uniref:Uncharacterized protein n=1 Tax=Digitaria exilis TaxID=1010633 RepID=A0A835BLK2_9POAL|nr:hypothetical protein HU200_039810 [Digitaria exilis]